MVSDDSDDEPLSVIALAKKVKSEEPIGLPPDIEVTEVSSKRKRKNAKNKKAKNIDTSSELSIKLHKPLPVIIKRPKDVWLYFKDLNPVGPYTCLLCTDWFLKRSQMVLHYILNHKKDFCGICRYFIPERDQWWSHQQFHAPWPCSQCVESFESEYVWRQHFSKAHNLVHCRLCHFRVPDNDQYLTHLVQKHAVTNVASKDQVFPWDFEFQGSTHFTCLLCSRYHNPNNTFYNHYIGYHHLTLKCLTNLVSGKDVPFTISGADLSSDFVEKHLKEHKKVGYVQLEVERIAGQQSEDKAYIPIEDLIKEEVLSEPEEKEGESNSTQVDPSSKPYRGHEDFDMTLTDIFIVQKCYYHYVTQVLNSINSNVVPEMSDIHYDTAKPENFEWECSICKAKFETVQHFGSHMTKFHGIKVVPIFSCRVCATTFENQTDLDNHTVKELCEFDDLWICQFCDRDFSDREMTRKHLTEHMDVLQFDNCFSPHLGFKCMYCPNLFWNETDRETHQVRVHLNKHIDQYYKCEPCSEVFSDKVWYIHHYFNKHEDINGTETPHFLLKCRICAIVQQDVDKMREHFCNTHPESRKLFCSLPPCCYKPLSHRKSLKLHVKTIHGQARDHKIVCTICSKEFQTSQARGAHMSQMHGAGHYKCKLCDDVLRSVDERKLHYLLRHPGQHQFPCASCGKSFRYKSSLYLHRQQHAVVKQNYACAHCGKVFTKKDSYREHIQIHAGPRHACSYCPMRFVQRSNMLRHERIHTGERPYSCSHCPKAFADKGAMKAHVMTHSSEVSFVCVYCGQTFAQKSKLTYHIRRHTGENLETCSLCSKIFTSACSLREHMKIHNNKKDAFKCPLCDRGFQDERYMLRHLRTTHTRAPALPCPLCAKTLSSSAGLRHHVLTHSKLKAMRCKCCPKMAATKRSMLRHLRYRHGLSAQDVNLNDYLTGTDPRDCNLGLSEEVMTRIFGPPKKKNTDILIADFGTLAKDLNIKTDNNDDEDDDDDDDEQADEEDDEQAEEDDEIDIDDDHSQGAKEGGDKGDESAQELEPTDFVTIKMESIEDNDYDFEG